MVQPIAFSEHILYQTVRLECSGYTGTGFIYGFKVGEEEYLPVIITNKHVVDNLTRNTVKFSLHTKDTDGKVLPNVVHYSWESDWIFHPNDKVDLCCTLFKPIMEEAKKNGINLFFSTCNDELIPTDEELCDLQTVNDVLMVGYPDGLYDEKHFLPIIRKGITSSHPSIDYDGECIGVIDIGCVCGSSGSPVYSYPGISQFSKSKGMIIGSCASKLLGIFFAGAVADAEGKIKAKKPKISELLTNTEIWINLGYYIKSREILILKDTVLLTYPIK